MFAKISPKRADIQISSRIGPIFCELFRKQDHIPVSTGLERENMPKNDLTSKIATSVTHARSMMKLALPQALPRRLVPIGVISLKGCSRF